MAADLAAAMRGIEALERHPALHTVAAIARAGLAVAVYRHGDLIGWRRTDHGSAPAMRMVDGQMVVDRTTQGRPVRLTREVRSDG